MTKRAYFVVALTILLLVSALATGFDLFYRTAYALALALVASFVWTRLNLLWFSVHVERRTLRLQVGEPIEERITVTNWALLPKAWLLIEEATDIPDHVTGYATSLARRAFRSWRTHTIARRRGHYTLGPVQVSAGDPLGLFYGRRLFHGRQRVLVYPRTVELPGFSLPEADLSGDSRLYRRTHHVSPLASSVREYVAGDSMKRIHWPTTARMGRLMVKEYDAGLSSDVWLLVDLDASVHASDGHDSSDELAVTVAASVGKRLLREGRPVGLVAHGDRQYLLPPDRGFAQLERMLELLALAQTGSRATLEQAMVGMDALSTRYNTLVIVTPSHRVQWLQGIRTLRHRRLRVVTILIDSSGYGARESVVPLSKLLAAESVVTYILHRGQDVAQGLSGEWPASSRRPEPVADGVTP